MPSLMSSATSLPSMAAKKAESLASSTSAETAVLERKWRERQRSGSWFCATGDGSNARGGRGTRRARGRAQVDHASPRTGSEDSLDISLRGGVLASELRLLSEREMVGKRVSGKP